MVFDTNMEGVVAVSIPKHYELYREVLQSLETGGVRSITEIRDFVAEQKNVSEEDRTIPLKSGRRLMFDDRVYWARTYLKAAGFIDYPKRGFTQITDEGKKVLNENPQPLDTAYLSKYESFRAFVGSKPKDDAGEAAEDDRMEQTPQERMDSSFSQINSVLSGEILGEIMALSPTFFEWLVVRLLEQMGYGGSLDGAGVVTPRSGDDGIDGIIREDKLGFSNIYIQAKRYALDRTVNKPELQGFVGAIANKAGKGLFITTAKFSDGARQCAKENHIVLVDGDKLAELMIEYGVGVSTIQTYEIKKLDSDFFAE